jgi:plastocyanin
MRGALATSALLFGFAFAAAAPAAQAADVHISNFAFSPTPVTIAQGETVTWHWDGPDTNHSVTADKDQADSFDSDPGRSPTAADHPPTDTFDHTFNAAGTFTYFCKVHPFMTGKVVVEGPPGSGPPPDTTPPALTGVSAKGGRVCPRGKKHCKPRPTSVGFTLSEDATVILKVAHRAKATVSKELRAGKHVLKLSTRKLPVGKWTVSITATDGAGNTSAPVKRSVTVKRG